MPFTGVYHPEQLAVLSEVLDDHCASFCIERSSLDHHEFPILQFPIFHRSWNWARTNITQAASGGSDLDCLRSLTSAACHSRKRL
jgi:hypothetical protein